VAALPLQLVTLKEATMTEGEEGDFLQVYHKSRKVLGEEAVHEAVLLTLMRNPSNKAAYLLTCARRLRGAFYTDRGMPPSRYKTWDREQLDDNDKAYDMTVTWNPASQVEAREMLSMLPLWLIKLHLDTGFVAKRMCWDHGTEHWYIRIINGRNSLSCRRCISLDNKRRRE
jgi:hypothetical protein